MVKKLRIRQLEYKNRFEDSTPTSTENFAKYITVEEINLEARCS